MFGIDGSLHMIFGCFDHVANFGLSAGSVEHLLQPQNIGMIDLLQVMIAFDVILIRSL